MTWYRELSQGQRLLMVAVSKGVTVVELSIMAVLVNQAARFAVRKVSDLWDGGLVNGGTMRYSALPLPYTRQGILKGLEKLKARGWIELRDTGRYYRSNPYEREVALLPLAVLNDAPAFLQVGSGSLDPDAATPVASDRGQRPLRSKATAPKDATPVTSGRKKPAARLADRTLRISNITPPGAIPERVVVVVVRVPATVGGQNYRCTSPAGFAPPAFYPLSSHSMPGAARTYAAKVFRRFLDRDIEPFELSPSHEGGGRFSYTLKSKKGGK